VNARAIAAEALGTALLLTAVIGSGIMGESLAGGNAAIALLANTAATGAALVVLITILGPISGAHSLPDTFAGIAPSSAPGFIAAQLVAAVAAWAACSWLFSEIARHHRQAS
jgi:glycerol uptake facilitator-like aquaporin